MLRYTLSYMQFLIMLLKTWREVTGTRKQLNAKLKMFCILVRTRSARITLGVDKLLYGETEVV